MSEFFGLPRVLRCGDFPDGPPAGPLVCGIDEAGRGPLAGPVAAAAVVLPATFPLGILGDSKALSRRRREEAFALIALEAFAWRVGWASPAEIDELNILCASMLAMRRAWDGLLGLVAAAPRDGADGGAREGAAIPGIVFVDGNRFPDLGRPAWPVVGGDAIVPAVMAASIVAKVERDRAMERYDRLYPEYGYARHKGYPTREHRALCRELGPSPIQRMSFRY